ncbi:MAG: hypothetical protein MI921_04400 [Cytophagales bacterium]|nr:hypothetical protein [Cytophagales bacterium]
MMLFLVFVGSLFLLINLILIMRIVFAYLEQSYEDQREEEGKKIDLTIFNKTT